MGCWFRRVSGSLIVALLSLLLLNGCAGTARAEALAFTTLDRGYHSGITEQAASLITSPDRWKAYWDRHAAIFIPPPPPPPVDFAAESLVAVNLGERRTGGYGVTITSVERDGTQLKVTAAESRPSPDAMVTMSLTQPYHVIRIPRVEPGTVLAVQWQVGTAEP